MATPYEDDQVTEILIDGAPDWLPIKRGSFEVIEVSIDPATRTAITAIDKMDGSSIFFYPNRLIAVKFTTNEESSIGIHPLDGRLLP